MGRPRGGSITDWRAEPLGAVPDRAIAARLGVSRQAVSAQRRRRGIASCKYRTARTSLLREVVENVLRGHHYPVGSTQVWQEALAEYGTVSLRSVQRVLAKLREAA